MIKWTRTRQALEEFAQRVKDAGILAQGLSERMCPEASAAACPKACLPRCQEMLWNFCSIWLFLLIETNCEQTNVLMGVYRCTACEWKCVDSVTMNQVGCASL